MGGRVTKFEPALSTHSAESMPTIRIGGVHVGYTTTSSSRCRETITTTYINITDGSSYSTTETVNNCQIDPLTLGLGLGLGIGIPAVLLFAFCLWRGYRGYQAEKRFSGVVASRVTHADDPEVVTVDLRSCLSNAAYLDWVNDRPTDVLKKELMQQPRDDVRATATAQKRTAILEWLDGLTVDPV